MQMRCGVKFCGGCKETFGRRELYERFRLEGGGISFSTDSATYCEADALLVICGCPVKCADYGGLNRSGNYVVVGEKEDYGAAMEQLHKIREEKRQCAR